MTPLDAARCWTIKGLGNWFIAWSKRWVCSAGTGGRKKSKITNLSRLEVGCLGFTRLHLTAMEVSDISDFLLGSWTNPWEKQFHRKLLCKSSLWKWWTPLKHAQMVNKSPPTWEHGPPFSSGLIIVAYHLGPSPNFLLIEIGHKSLMNWESLTYFSQDQTHIHSKTLEKDMPKLPSSKILIQPTRRFEIRSFWPWINIKFTDWQRT